MFCGFLQLVSFALLEDSPLYVPLHPYQDAEQETKCLDSSLSAAQQVQEAKDCLETIPKHLTSDNTFRRWTIMDYSSAYGSGAITPHMVAQRLISAIMQSSDPGMDMSFFINYEAHDILKQATESTLRYEKGESISVLDGVPIAIKDEIDCLPYPTTGGTKWLHKVRACKEDAACVERLRSCGAILVGKTNMHELGAGTSGINPHYGTSRNPYDPKRICGGSSSGSAAVVCAGLCPVALGVDGGGSVRMPAALCGVVGLKPSFGRIPHSGVIPLNWTVGMVGILAGTVEDSLIVYAAMSGEAETSQPTVPKLYLPMLKPSYQMYNIRLAKSKEWFNDCSDEIRTCCLSALDNLHKCYGWQTVEVTIPDIEAMRLAHYVTIGSECSASLSRHMDKHNKSESGSDVRAAFSVYGAFNSGDYLNAQRIRNRQMKIHEKIFSMADVIVTPTVGVTAYEIKDDVQETGELDYINGAALIRYSIAGNFLGLPAVTVPVGYDKLGLPIGIQFIGKPWSEAMLIHIAYAMEALCKAEYRKPQVYYDLLAGN
ncbi:putative fatty acid amide hydrolase [Helianthus annuus]|nr:putative fatty acid amide hydrolase [Helianthus annuus]KAJ0471912.1 putative fatty acid amide hydrolase [Helianthus annuus]KAJ0647518.1 putative fatty acid amide hydrolase [Helianthus annuus]KAJ0843334.1 putative fatty acid amide hydrolase [Helianthus annuus]